MNTVLNELRILRKDNNPHIDTTNHNRYGIIIDEGNYLKTAYIFSTPIYNNTSRKIVNRTFSYESGYFTHTGSNASVFVGDHIYMKNQIDGVHVYCPDLFKSLTQKADILYNNKCEIHATLNGVAIKIRPPYNSHTSPLVTFEITTDHTAPDVKNNGKYFALMGSQYKPLFTISTMMSKTANSVMVPPSITYQKRSSNSFSILLIDDLATGEQLEECWLELNLYEEKIVADTTVESANKTVNNVYGSTAFIGITPQYGQQILYSRLDFSKLMDFWDQKIEHIYLHIPCFNSPPSSLIIRELQSRFCSFGSTWDNRVFSDSKTFLVSITNSFLKIDLSPFCIDSHTKTLILSEGFILKAASRQNKYTAIVTGDSYYMPQILEIQFSCKYFKQKT